MFANVWAYGLGRCTVCRDVSCTRFRTRANHLFHHSIERGALGALHTEKVPVPVSALCLAIVAHDIHHPLQVRRHGLFGNVTRTGLPRCCHALLGHDSLFANGAPVVKAGELAEAVGVNGMAAWQVLRTLT